MRNVLWLLSALGALGGGAIIALGFLTANGAPQEAAAGALGCGIAIIPYVLARAVDELGRKAG